jgi:hypothetical protein
MLENSIEILHETPSQHPNFKLDLVKACVLAAGVSQEHFKETVENSFSLSFPPPPLFFVFILLS